MSVMQTIIGRLLRSYTRRQARGKTLQQMTDELESSGAEIMPRILRAQDTAGNREAINHFIGIERWSVNRLRVASGAVEFELDSNRRYRLPDDAPLADLQADFQAARRETLALARQMQESGMNTDITVEHNDLGPLTVIEWLFYIKAHPAREVRRIREMKA